MKKYIKALTLFLTIITCFCCLFGCKKTSSIPDGLYRCLPDDNIYESIYKLTENDVRDSCAIEVNGDEIQQWTSGLVCYKAKIVEKDGEIYFEGYKWRDLFDILFRNGKERVATDIYRVIYDENKKSMTVILVRNG